MKKVLIYMALGIVPFLFAAELNKRAPAFSLPGIDGKTHSISDYKGKIVVLEWLNFGCPFVKKHYNSGNMQNLQKEFTKKGVIWLSIVSSAPGKQGYYTAYEMKKIAEKKHSSATTILLDPRGKTGRAYSAKTTPHMYIINKDQNLVYQGAIDSIPSTDQDDIKEAVNYVSKALGEVMAGEKVATPSTQAYGCSVKYGK